MNIYSVSPSAVYYKDGKNITYVYHIGIYFKDIIFVDVTNV